MSKAFVVAVFDSAMNAFAAPVFVASKGVAVRSFGDEVNRNAENNALNRHPEDYALYVLAVFDEENGKFEENAPTLLVRGKDVIKSS